MGVKSSICEIFETYEMAIPEYAKYACKHAGTTVRFFFLGGGLALLDIPRILNMRVLETKYACKLNMLTVC
jgi:hypothetical protein